VATVRRRSRQAASRLRLVKFFLTDDELAELDEAAGRQALPGARSLLRSRWPLREAGQRRSVHRYAKP
jgi:hypothetical protein